MPAMKPNLGFKPGLSEGPQRLLFTTELALNTGVRVAYWRAVRMDVCLCTMKAVVDCEGYVSQALFESGAPPVLRKSVSIDFELFAEDKAAELTALIQSNVIA